MGWLSLVVLKMWFINMAGPGYIGTDTSSQQSFGGDVSVAIYLASNIRPLAFPSNPQFIPGA